MFASVSAFDTTDKHENNSTQTGASGSDQQSAASRGPQTFVHPSRLVAEGPGGHGGRRDITGSGRRDDRFSRGGDYRTGRPQSGGGGRYGQQQRYGAGGRGSSETSGGDRRQQLSRGSQLASSTTQSVPAQAHAQSALPAINRSEHPPTKIRVFMMVGGDYPGQSQLDISSEETAPTYVDTYGFPDSTFVELDQQLRALFPPDTYFPSHLIAFNVVSDAENPSLYRVDKNIRFLAARDALPRQLRKCAFVRIYDLLALWFLGVSGTFACVPTVVSALRCPRT